MAWPHRSKTRSFFTQCIMTEMVGVVLLCWTTLALSVNEADLEVETLTAIEVPGTIVTQKKREFPLLSLEIEALTPFPSDELTYDSLYKNMNRSRAKQPKSLRDPIADTLGVRTSVSPIKAERPPYPLIARKQGWEGTVILRLEILPNGTVGMTKLKETSGHQLLDESAIQTVQKWQFIPAKDGEFPIRVFVDLPVTFNLNR